MLTIVISAPECSAYFCSEIEIEQDICIISHVSAHEIKKCPKDFYCNKYSKKCEQSDNQVAFPGNKCTTKQFCLGSCESGICRGLHKGESCKNHIDCDPHLMCYNGSCRPKVSQHQSCYKDFECPNDMFCHNNKCAKYFSLPRDEVIDICHEYESKKCASGMCQQNRCMDELVVPRKSNIPCVSSFCEIESGEHT